MFQTEAVGLRAEVGGTVSRCQGYPSTRPSQSTADRLDTGLRAAECDLLEQVLTIALTIDGGFTSAATAGFFSHARLDNRSLIDRSHF